MMGQLLAGFGVADVSPPVGLWHIGRQSDGIRDDLRATALVLEVAGQRAAIVSVDVITLSRPSVAVIRERIAAEAGVPPERTVILSAHTHSSPVTHPIGSQFPDDDYVRLLEKSIAGAVVAAARQLVPARVSYGEGRVGFSINRRLKTATGVQMLPNPAGPIDRRVRALRLDAADPDTDLPLGVMFSVCCHPTSFPTSSATGADYPGATRRVIEHAYDGQAKALFLPGAFGNVRPSPLDGQGRFRSVTGVELDRMGRALGAEVVRAAEECSGIPREPGVETPTWEGDGGLAGARWDVPLLYGTLPTWESLLASTSRYEQVWKQQMLARLERDGRFPEGEPCEVQALRLGPFLIVAIGGEPFVELGQAIEAQLAGAPGIAEVLVLGYANGCVGYLCTAEAYAEGGYESASAHVNYHRPAPFAADTETRIVSGAVALARQLI